MAAYPNWTLLLLHYARRELPAWGRVLAFCRVSGWRYDSSLWANAPTVVTRGKLHGFLMRLDLSDWSERTSYFLGRYYELHLQLLFPALLKPGDRVVDVGANIGMLALSASALVREAGLVECFEPNPGCVERLLGHLDLNGIGNVVVHPVGLSDAPGRSTLRLQTNRRTPSMHSGIGTLAPVAETPDDVVVGAYDVEVRRGDDILLGNDRRVALIKIDVEGFELKALRGLRGALERWHPAVITEYLERHLARAGTSRAEIRAWMEALGYRPHAIHTARRLLRHRLRLVPLDGKRAEGLECDDVLWLHAGDPLQRELQRFMT
jgi:FkbM family methyltransferase